MPALILAEVGTRPEVVLGGFGGTGPAFYLGVMYEGIS